MKECKRKLLSTITPRALLSKWPKYILRLNEICRKVTSAEKRPHSVIPGRYPEVSILTYNAIDARASQKVNKFFGEKFMKRSRAA